MRGFALCLFGSGTVHSLVVRVSCQLCTVVVHREVGCYSVTCVI